MYFPRPDVWSITTRQSCDFVRMLQNFGHNQCLGNRFDSSADLDTLVSRLACHLTFSASSDLKRSDTMSGSITPNYPQPTARLLIGSRAAPQNRGHPNCQRSRRDFPADRLCGGDSANSASRRCLLATRERSRFCVGIVYSRQASCLYKYLIGTMLTLQYQVSESGDFRQA